ncbi:hypothetical protein F4819DRAFT_483742 [Hypoxylon fuscum]|nr:hypothetical protein F4819DRAFT_483742 [Hypoxylon fuscum]
MHPLPSLLTLPLLASPALGSFFFDYLKANIDNSTWAAALSAPNATGTYAMRGFNLSAPASSAFEIPGWTMTVRVAADRATLFQDPDENGRYFTGTSISVRAPDALLRDDQVLLPANGSAWRVRAYVADALPSQTNEQARDDDGSCGSFLSAACISEWQAAYVSAANGTLPLVPASCRGALGTASGMWASAGFVPLAAFNGTELFARAATSSAPDGDLSAYARATREVWPVMLVYYSDDTRREQARLTCVRAKNVTAGSAQPNGAASVMTGMKMPTALWMTVGAVGAMVFGGL